eukprot:7718371-Pyramimonas_sp.AAC.1
MSFIQGESEIARLTNVPSAFLGEESSAASPRAVRARPWAVRRPDNPHSRRVRQTTRPAKQISLLKCVVIRPTSTIQTRYQVNGFVPLRGCLGLQLE